MFKLFLALVLLNVLAILAGCSNSVSSASTKQPVAGIYYLSPVPQYQSPQVFIWSGSSWRVGSESKNAISVNSCESFMGDSVANLVLKYVDGMVFNARTVRLPILSNDYGVADSSHPFSGIYGTHDNSYVFAITDAGNIIGAVGEATIIGPQNMNFFAEEMCTNFRDGNPPKLLLTGRNWGYISYNPISPQPLTGLLQWFRSDSTSIQLVGMDGCGR
ncbi:MAG: hypothetical protein PHE24_02210 [Patescibacteria group bacterium]|nr:hypothetical protein [Patescibacteria group bacterium]